jgi:signal transduction histidine kinase
VRNPLAGIKGAIQVLISRRPSDPDAAVMRDVVGRIDSLSDLINDLMVFARPRPPHASTFDVRPVILDAIAMLRRDPACAGMEVTVEGPDVRLTADAELIRSTVLNLLLNAGQAMGGRGRVAITIAQRDAACALEVRDSGPGIPADLRERIFEPFFTTKARGGGLGLPIARRTAELHGGTLTLAPAESGGAVFTLTLPLHALPEPAA